MFLHFCLSIFIITNKNSLLWGALSAVLGKNVCLIVHCCSRVSRLNIIVHFCCRVSRLNIIVDCSCVHSIQLFNMVSCPAMVYWI